MRKQAAAMRGQGSEPVELRPGIGARDAAHSAEVEQWAWRRGRSLRGFYTHLPAYPAPTFTLFPIYSATPRPGLLYAPLPRPGHGRTRAGSAVCGTDRHGCATGSGEICGAC